MNACFDDLEAERDDAVAALSAVTRLFAIGADAPTVDAAGPAIAEAVRDELVAEECAVCLRGPSGALMLIGCATQSARLGGPATGSRTAGLLALGQLVGESTTPRCFAAAADGGVAAVAFDALAGPGAVVLPFASADSPGGVILARWLIAPPIRFGRSAKLRLIATAVGQAVEVTRDREGRTRLVATLEEELGSRANDQQASTERIETLARELMVANRVKQEFLATMSHELRTPLNLILGFGALLNEGAAGPLVDAQTQLLEKLLNSSRHLHALIDDILFFVECECDRIDVSREAVVTADLIEGAQALLPADLASGAVTFDVVVADAASRLVVDPKLFTRLLFHLLANAFKFTRHGRVSVGIAAGNDQSVLVTVTDTGAGIPVEHMERIFQAFTQGDGASTRRFEGIGLGLTLVQRCVQLMGGTVRVESAVNVGTTVRVALPGVLAAAMPIQRRSRHAQPLSMAAKSHG